jgi:hypothetical protein
MSASDTAPRDESQTRVALGLAAATVVAWIVLAALDHDGAGWILLPVLGIAAAVSAWRAGGTSPQRNMTAFVALVVGVLAILTFLGFVIVGD